MFWFCEGTEASQLFHTEHFSWFTAFPDQQRFCRGKCERHLDHISLSGLPLEPLIDYWLGVPYSGQEVAVAFEYALGSTNAREAIATWQGAPSSLRDALFTWTLKTPLLLKCSNEAILAAVQPLSTRSLILAELDKDEAEITIPVRVNIDILRKIAGPVVDAPWPSGAVAAGGGVVAACNSWIPILPLTDLDIFVPTVALERDVLALLVSLGYRVEEKRKHCFSARLDGYKVDVVYLPCSSDPNRLIRQFDLFAAEAFWTPTNGAFATASAYLDWQRHVISGGRTVISEYRLTKWTQKGFAITCEATATTEEIQQATQLHVDGAETENPLLMRASHGRTYQRFFDAVPIHSVFAPASEDIYVIQTPWLFSLGFGRPDYAYASPQQSGSHEAFMRHLNCARRCAGLMEAIGSPYVNLVYQTNGASHMLDAPGDDRDRKPICSLFRGLVRIRGRNLRYAIRCVGKTHRFLYRKARSQVLVEDVFVMVLRGSWMRENSFEVIGNACPMPSSIGRSFEPNAPVSEQKPDTIESEEKPKAIGSEEKPKKTVSKKKQLKLVSEENRLELAQNRKRRVSEEKPKRLVSKEKQQELLSEKKPNRLALAQKRKRLVTEEKPKRLVLAQKRTRLMSA